MPQPNTQLSTDPACVCIALRKASRRLTAGYDAALAPVGISVAQFSLLRNIQRHAPVSLTGLSDIVELDRSTLGRNVRVLERMGLVEMSAGTDQREAALGLTSEGEARLRASLPRWEAAQQAIVARLGRTGIHQLEALLGSLQDLAL